MDKATHIHKKARLMGSPFEIQAYVAPSCDVEYCRMQIDLAFAEIRRIEDLLTDFRSSPFNAINDQAGIMPVAVNQEILDLLLMAQAVSKDSDGAFDISYASVGHLWRRAIERGVPPSPDEILAAKKFIDYRQIDIDTKAKTVFLRHANMRIGFGGVGKGYAVDRAFKLLANAGLENVMVNGAGDIRLQASATAPRPWQVGIRNPFAPRDYAMGYFELSRGAVATSGDYERFFYHNKQKHHHVLDARTGESTKSVASVTVMADTTTLADVYATTAMALGPDAGLTFLNRRRNVRGFLVTQDGRFLKTDNLSSKEVVRYG